MTAQTQLEPKTLPRTRPVPRRRYPGLRSAEQALERFAQNRLLTCITIMLVVMGLRAALLPVLPIPQPVLHDEFSYLLGGETLAKGRLANPPHPMWPFFETMHVNMYPTYASKYPSGQSVFLAAGIRLFGHPWYGVWLSMGLLCGALCWMLQGWLPPKYAVIGALFAVLQLGVTGLWMNSYWGGGVAALGGALAIGAAPRLVRNAGAGSAVAVAVSILLLANTRPFEGAVLLVLLGVAVLCWARRRGTLANLFRPRVVFSLVAGVAITAAAMAYYNWRVTGAPLVFPYIQNSREYRWSAPLWFLPESSPPPRFRDGAMKDLWAWDHNIHVKAGNNPLLVVRTLIDAVHSTFVNGPALPLAILAIPGILLVCTPRARIAVCLLGAFLGVVLMEQYILGHYLAPATGLLLLCGMFGVRLLRTSTVGRAQIGLPLVALLLAAITLLFLGSVFAAVRSPRTPAPMAFRARVLEKLEATPGRHLVMVRYGPKHDMHLEHVYNGPDIDAQKVVWALDRGEAENPRLFEYYRGRAIWLFEPDTAQPSLTEWTPGASADRPR